MRLDRLPERLLVIGAGYIAAELGGVMGALGSRVTFLLRGDSFLRREDEEISRRFTESYTRRFDVRTHTRILGARRDGDEVVLQVAGPDGITADLRGDELLVATGRRPNSDLVDAAAGGLAVADRGQVITDDQLRTNVDGVWALGDITNPVQLKHVANHEARVVRHNPGQSGLADRCGSPVHPPCRVRPSPDRRGRVDRARVPGTGSPIRVPCPALFGCWLRMGDGRTPRALPRSSPHRHTRRLLGGHIIGPQASTLIQQLIQGMHFDLTVDQMARDQYYIHPGPTRGRGASPPRALERSRPSSAVLPSGEAGPLPEWASPPGRRATLSVRG